MNKAIDIDIDSFIHHKSQSNAALRLNDLGILLI
ncbi:hypothetical protein SHLI107390_12740 [Shewanella livingstonensis]